MNSSNQEDVGVLLTTSGKIQNPMLLNSFLIIIKIISSFIGIPLNVFTAILIIRLRRLHSKPRNIFLLGIIFSNLSAFVPGLIELIYWNLPLESVCQVYVTVVGIPYAILLWNMFLALLDRYGAIKFPLWHRKKVTVRRVSGFLILSSLSIIFLLKFVYIFGFIPLRCEVRFVHSKVMGLITFGLFVLCTIIHFVVYRQTKTILKKSRTGNPLNYSGRLRNRNRKSCSELNVDKNPDNNRVTPSIEFAPNPMENEMTKNTKATGKISLIISNDRSMSKVNHEDSGTYSQMQMEATRTLIVGVTHLFVMACPPIVFFFIIHSCRFVNSFECNNLNWLAPYFKELLLVHAVYSPLIWLLRNDELWLVLKNKIDGM